MGSLLAEPSNRCKYLALIGTALMHTFSQPADTRRGFDKLINPGAFLLAGWVRNGHFYPYAINCQHWVCFRRAGNRMLMLADILNLTVGEIEVRHYLLID